MNNPYSTRKNLFDIWYQINKKRKLQLCFLFLLMVLSSIAEMFTLASSVPFLSLIINTQEIFKNKYIFFLIKYFGIYDEKNVIIFITLLFAFFSIITTFVRLTNLWLNTRIAALIGSDLSCKLFDITLKQDYEFHLNNNSSKSISLNTRFISDIVGVINQTLQFILSFLIVIGITTTLLIIDWQIALFSIFIFLISYSFVVYFSKRRLISNSKVISNSSEIQIKSLQEGLGAIKDLILNSAQNIYLNSYKNADLPLRKKEAESSFISTFPRYFVEAIGMVLIAFLALFLIFQKENKNEIIPILGSLALGAQRLLPALQQMYSGWASVNGNAVGIRESLNRLQKNVPLESKVINKKCLNFSNCIKLIDLSYKYPNTSNYVLNNLNLEIKKGDKVGIIGKTGSGKSTLVNILMGLIYPNHGALFVDEKKIDNNKNVENLINWRANISYVPQEIYLSDNSFRENIGFGINREDIDNLRIAKVAKKANIYEYIMSLKKSFNTYVGERGVKLSGGQKQRIGIARALYKNSEVLFLDEATSSLDVHTEKKIMSLIYELDPNLTIIIIAHRLSTLSNCDKIIELDGGKIKKIFSPNELT